MPRHKLVMAARTFADVEIEREHLRDDDVEVVLAPLETPAEIAAATAGADGVIVTVDPLPAASIAAFAPTVRVIGRAGIGLDAIDLDAAAGRGVGVVHVPDYATEEVATHAFALILALQRRLLAGDALARRDYGAWRELTPVAPLSEQTAAVVGLGRIGRATAALLAPLFGRVLGYDPLVTEAPEGVELAGSLDALLAAADVVTLHLPLTPETTALIDAPQLRVMKRGALLVNVSRGGLIDQPALARALHDGEIAGAGLDVLVAEPPAAGDPILSAPNVLLSPHFGWYSTAAERRARTMTVDAMLDYLAGGELRGGRVALDGRSAVS
ncbi:C-terminal binding protein [Conexibacter stalactiti]|uniref:C-terminal binding protein n=1 Tax=Conexibacter stalactiti TaxID=1940611 RepID=A0ABU4HY55_9ACTN|nr:C-terminal binding protein [Conexibacter stalactiti]MDW5598257.1 C-terminal binding protein [Conexibacter stalactiti]MEC5038899.1 C-terminal binding protein [Conexibacter stalactiti]